MWTVADESVARWAACRRVWRRPPRDHRCFVETISGGVAAASVSIDVAGWVEEFACGFAVIAGRFRRREPRLQARSFLLGVLSDVDTRSCWQLAEQAGDSDPNAMQRLLGEAVWDADAVRDDVRGYVIDAIGHPDGVLILDDTGDLKRGSHSVGVQRQYTGTAGRIENAQVSVFLAYASPAGRALIDRAVYLPVSWTDDPDRCAAAGIPADVAFATKITLGRRMLQRAGDAGVPAAWATADEFYGGDRGLRRDLQTRRLGYVLAVAKSHRVNTGGLHGLARADRIAATLGKKAWNRYSAGQGAKGRREYDWAWVALTPPPDEATGFHWLLIRRRISDGELAFYRCYSSTRVGLPTLVRVAGTRWAVECCFQNAKGAVGLDQHQVRRWDSWHRYTTLVMLAHAILTVIALRERQREPAGEPGLIRLTVNEIRRLFAKLITHTDRPTRFHLAWSRWRRIHQARARTSHYRARGHIDHRLPST
jgi:SRSO17 transposase